MPPAAMPWLWHSPCQLPGQLQLKQLLHPNGRTHKETIITTPSFYQREKPFTTDQDVTLQMHQLNKLSLPVFTSLLPPYYSNLL